MKTKIYLAGRINGNAGYREEFGEAERFYRERGFTVLNPAQLPEGMEQADYMRICVAMIDSAEIVMMLPDWEMSPGARVEKAYAEYAGKTVALHEEQTDGPGARNPEAEPAEQTEEPKRRKRRSIADWINDLFMTEEF